MALHATASAQPQYYEANIDGLQESPPVATTGSGFGNAVYNPATDVLSVNISFSNLIGTTQDAHIHCCWGEPGDPPGTNASVAIGFPAHGFPIGVTSGTFTADISLAIAANYTGGFLAEGGGTAAGARNKLLAAMNKAPNAGGAYFNIHSTFRPGGEIRGDIFRVPEPASVLMLLGGLAAIALRRRAR